MNIFGKFYCRAYQGIMKLVLPMMPYREPQILESVTDIPGVLAEKQIDKVMIVTDRSIEELGLTSSLIKSLKDNNINFEVFNDVVPNPTVDLIEKAVGQYNSTNCKGIIALGGGSVIDAA
jgi:alcohol dehydrogenase class IV